ncbi:hypothetical protein DOTSEDRAFT_178205 [Dothistroma septosporum NZE10]|uniref:Asparaginase n=1 Tax=Dothistroma septosporum (strain NZE10 / CBS 128990) TaxID=675120 RepID=N1PEX9_DOTSN|nr:hypothetical protein DOTSEDRAFT_178205 [Dothistroma septosporum NZE10]
MTLPNTPRDCIISDRGSVIENTHKVHIAIVDSSGELLFSVGDASRVTLLRSAAKPAQALAILETKCFDQYDFNDQDLALVCASHDGEKRHIRRARSILSRIGLTENDLACGSHPSISEAVIQEWYNAHLRPGPICNNCSGKHAGMLAGSLALGAESRGYEDPNHPMQLKVRDVFEQLLAGDDLRWSTDDCNLPAPACSLTAAAKLFVQFAWASDGTYTSNDKTSARRRDMARIFNAMSQYPAMIGGGGGFCTLLTDAYRGALIGKVGADGCYGIAIRESEQTRDLGAEGAVGVALKIEDGNLEALYCAVADVLEQLDIGTKEQRQNLETFHHPRRFNAAGVQVGRMLAAFRLQPTQQDPLLEL